jgi:hypothetical protein
MKFDNYDIADYRDEMAKLIQKLSKIYLELQQQQPDEVVN